jgi:hypothetical protein
MLLDLVPLAGRCRGNARPGRSQDGGARLLAVTATVRPRPGVLLVYRPLAACAAAMVGLRLPDSC